MRRLVTAFVLFTLAFLPLTCALRACNAPAPPVRARDAESPAPSAALPPGAGRSPVFPPARTAPARAARVDLPGRAVRPVFNAPGGAASSPRISGVSAEEVAGTVVRTGPGGAPDTARFIVTAPSATRLFPDVRGAGVGVKTVDSGRTVFTPHAPPFVSLRPRLTVGVFTGGAYDAPGGWERTDVVYAEVSALRIGPVRLGGLAGYDIPGGGVLAGPSASVRITDGVEAVGVYDVLERRVAVGAGLAVTF